MLLVTACGTTTTSHAEQSRTADQRAEANVSGAPVHLRHVPIQSDRENISLLLDSDARPTEAIQVGEYVSQHQSDRDEPVITQIQSHQLNGRRAATLYLRNIPVLTFMGSSTQAQDGTSVTEPETISVAAENGNATVSAPVKVAESETVKVPTNPGVERSLESTYETEAQPAENVYSSNAEPVWRASAIAAKLNTLYRSNVAAEITVNWNGEVNSAGEIDTERYLIKVNGEDLVVIDQDTKLPDTTNDLAEDAIQVTNRLRRLIASAPPIREIADKPKPKPPEILHQEAILYQIKGWASWYGPGFDGRLSASGEVFNQNALTAAHVHLPFGTRVRVTNLNNGLSVVVRINDRGPFVGGRIIDLSAAAAQILGMIDNGVAPVSVDVLDTPNNAYVNQ